MNKLTLMMNAWRAYNSARKCEGSSLRGLIMGGASAAVVVVYSLMHGDLTAYDVGVISAGIAGLDSALKYFIPDQIGGVTLTAQQGEFDESPLPETGSAGTVDAADADADRGTAPKRLLRQFASTAKQATQKPAIAAANVQPQRSDSSANNPHNPWGDNRNG